MNNKSIYICVSNNKKGGFFPWLQRFVTGINVTHSEPILHQTFYNNYVGLSADKVCTLEYIQDLINNINIEVWIYELPISEYDCDSVFIREDILCHDYLGKNYGFFQILYFIMRRFVGLFGFDARRWWNPFPTGKICSEICYNYFMIFSEELPEAFINELDNWKPDNIHSGDIKYLMDKYFCLKNSISE